MNIRDLKLDLVLGNKNTIINKFDEITKNLKVIKTDVYEDHGQEFIFYNENNEWIFYQDVKNEDFWCNYKLYWSFFEDKLCLKYEEIQEITKYMVEETLKIKVDTPSLDPSCCLVLVEETLKIKIDTPFYIRHSQRNLVEETLKSKL